MKAIRQSINRTIGWLGPTRAQAFFVLLAVTGLGSLILNIIQPQPVWVRAVQSLLVIAFLIGAALIVISRFPVQDRRHLVFAIGPAIIAISLGILYPQFIIFFAAIGIGWLLISMVLMRGRVRQEYQTAIKHMRNNEYDQAVDVISDVIKEEPENPDHRRFRAELYRMAGKIKRARADYQKVIELTPDSPVGYNGLAEVYLQDGEFQEALSFAQKALELEPDYWVAPYNLGMIEDRLNMSEQAIEHLDHALAATIPDSRHRLLTYLWIARAQFRLGHESEAKDALQKMKREKLGLEEWTTIFESEAAAVLKAVLEDDVNVSAKLVNDNADLSVLTGAPA
jgi:tetratricopeptide (TPR) repeat protein